MTTAAGQDTARNAKRNRATDRISDAAVQTKTGRTWAEWFAALDAAGAPPASHRGVVAAVLQLRPGVSGWWRQMVAVAYEQHRGGRDPYRKGSGYEVSVSRTLDSEFEPALRAWTEAPLRRRWLGAAVRVEHRSRPGALRLTSAAAQVADIRVTRAGRGRTRIVVEQRRLADAAAVEACRAYWRDSLERLRVMLNAGGGARAERPS